MIQSGHHNRHLQHRTHTSVSSPEKLLFFLIFSFRLPSWNGNQDTQVNMLLVWGHGHSPIARRPPPHWCTGCGPGMCHRCCASLTPTGRWTHYHCGWWRIRRRWVEALLCTRPLAFEPLIPSTDVSSWPRDQK